MPGGGSSSNRRTLYPFIQPKGSIKKELLAHQRSRSVISVPNSSSGENYRNGIPRVEHLQHKIKDDSVIKKNPSSFVSNMCIGVTSRNSGHNLPTVRNDAKNTQIATLACHSYQTSTDCVQYDRMKMNFVEDTTLSSHSGSVQSLVSNSSIASSVNVRQDFFHNNNSSSCHSKSPRNLTKDSGYETCAQAEHDYVNMDWVANSNIQNRNTLSPPGYHVPKKNPSTIDVTYSSDENPLFHRRRHALTSACSPTEKCSYQYSPSSNSSFSCDDCSNPYIHMRSFSSSSSKCTGSYNSLYSSTESLSSCSSKPNSIRLRSSKSSISLANQSRSPSVDYQQVVTSCHYLKTVTPAQSTPDLYSYEKMVPPRANKRPSIYEELAFKSGFDFSPMIQRQSFRFQKGIQEDLSTKDAYLSYSCQLNNESFHSLPENCEKTKIPINSRNCFSPVKEANQVFHKADVESSLPPPVPTRDSSLRFRTVSAHEKFPSWPVSIPNETHTNCISTHSSGHRSSSWTEQTRCVKNFGRCYSRPKKHFLISTQQLHPVQEKNKKNYYQQNILESDSDNHEQHLGSFNCDDVNFTMLTNHFKFDDDYQNNEKYNNAHSPPERDITAPIRSENEQISEHSRQFESNEYSTQSSNIYENLRRVESPCQSTTPLLDRLRSERGVLPESWPRFPDSDTRSETGTCVSSNSSSQETLKWHGSFSDLSSVHTCTRSGSPILENDYCTMHEENITSAEADSTSHFVGYIPLSLPELPGQNDRTKFCPCVKLNTTPYAVVDVACKQNKLQYSNGKIGQKTEEPKRQIHNLQSSNSQQQFRDCVSEDESIKKCSPYLGPSSNSRLSRNLINEPYRDSESRLDTHMSMYSPNLTDEVISANNTQPVVNTTRAAQFEKFVSTVDERYRENDSAPKKSDFRHVLNSKSCHESDVAYLRKENNENTSAANKTDLALKAIQKQAVLSFYHRQTTIAAKDFKEKKARSSSFSYAHENLTYEKPLSPVAHGPQQQRKRVLSSSSFSQQLSQELSCKPTVSNPASCESRQNKIIHEQKCYELKPTVEPVIFSPMEKDHKMHHDLFEISVPDSSLELDEAQQRLTIDKNFSEVSPLTKDLADPVTGKSKPGTSLRVQTASRKALLQKTYKSNDSTVVKVISPKGETLAQNFATKNCNQLGSKPQVPRKRIHKNVSVPPAKSENLFMSSLSAQDSCEEELLLIEANSKNHQDSCQVESDSSSPDLPLPPPPPQNLENGGFAADDPFPPPPDPLDLALTEFEKQSHCCFQNISAFLSNDVSLKVQSHENSEQLLIKDEPVSSSENRDFDILSPLIPTSPVEKSLQPYSENLNEEVLLLSVIKEDSSTSSDLCENEAIYVNLNFQREFCQKPVSNIIQKSFQITSSANVTNTATQTSKATPSLQRKSIATSKSDFISGNNETSSLAFGKQLNKELCSERSVPSEIEFSYSDGIQPHENVKPFAERVDINLNNSSYLKNDILLSHVDYNISRDDMGLPLTYFTTSEPKAKLLTRYYQSFDDKCSDQVELKGQKDELVQSLSKKLNIMRLEQIELKEEMKQNEELGKEISAKIEKIAKPNEVQKYRVHVEESEQITNLLLSLSGRLSRAENALLILPKDSKSEEKNVLEAKRNKLSQQLDEAWQLKKNIDRRSCQVSLFLHHYLSKEEYADYEHFIKMKPKLLMDAREIDEKIKLGEEQLMALHGTFQGYSVNDELTDKKCDLTVLNNP